MATQTTSDLLASIKSRTLMPTSQNTFTDLQLLALADDELASELLPIILSTREDYYTTYKDFAAAASLSIPARAVGMTLEDVVTVDSSGNETSVPQIDRTQQSRNAYFGFHLRGNKVVFSSTPTSTVRLYYPLSPSKLIKPSAAAQITDITGTDVTVASLPSTITTATSIDFVKRDPGYESLSLDQSISSIASTTLTFALLPDDLAVGDFVCLAGDSPVVQCPPELMPALAQGVAVKVLEALGDREGMAVAQGKLNRMQSAALSLLQPRVSGESKKVINYNSSLRRRKW